MLAGSLVLAGASATALAADPIEPGSLVVESPTLHSVGFEWTVVGDDNRNATVSLEYRPVGSATWRQGLPLLRQELINVPPALPLPFDNFAGSALFLMPGTTYEFRLTLDDPDGGSDEQVVEARTRSVPVASHRGRTLHVVPGSGGGTGTAADPFKGLAAADANALPGDIFLVEGGTYAGPFVVTQSGSEADPIVYRGVGADAVTLEGNLDLDNQSYVFVEGMTVRNTTAAIRASNTTGIVLRYLKIIILGADDVAMSMLGYSRDNYICDNEVTGADVNFPAYSNGSAEGLLVNGEGHVICHNRISHFRDAISLAQSVDQDLTRSVDIHDNDIFEVHDDCVETDYSLHNVRVFRNRMRHFTSGVSGQPSFAGPLYIVRNEFFNTLAAPPGNPNTGSAFKFSESSGYCTTGILVYNNTSINVGFGFAASTIFPNSALRNNLMYGDNGKAFELYEPEACSTSSLTPMTFDYNGMNTTWGPWASIDHVDYSLDQFRSELGNEVHGYEATLAEFQQVPSLTHNTWYTPADYDLSLSSSAHAIDNGLVIAGINDDVEDGMPDIGAYERGAAAPNYGPRVPGVPSPPANLQVR